MRFIFTFLRCENKNKTILAVSVMALVTIQRSPSISSNCNSPPSSDSTSGTSVDDEDPTRVSRSLSECYFAGKGAAVVLPPNDRVRPRRSSSAIQQHLQSMFYLLRTEDTLKMAVKLESDHPGRARYLVVVSCIPNKDNQTVKVEESCILGIDCNQHTTVGLVLKVLADTRITLDGDGGFSVKVCDEQHIFKPVSVQAMWSALQTLHKVSSKAREHNFFKGGGSHDWVNYYEQRVESDRSCLNEWHTMDCLESRRPPSPDSVRSKPCEREDTERVIRAALKEIMMSVDLDEVTSKYIRGSLEEHLDMDLGEFKSFIDQEMLVILGQMDAATEIFEHVYLGSEWNASNLEELQKNGVRHILNVTKEIDNFFPGMFNYQNIRVYDDEKTDLLRHWDNTYRYINSAKECGSKVLVHCKMGVSRSASVVIAYAMKAYNWDYKKAFDYVKQKRSCIKPNTSFISQLETYQGILDAMKNREKLQQAKFNNMVDSMKHHEKLQRSKSETNLEIHRPSSTVAAKEETQVDAETSGIELSKQGTRPKSWSPDNTQAENFFKRESSPGLSSASLDQLSVDLEKPPTSPSPNSEASKGINFPTTNSQRPHLMLSIPKEIPDSNWNTAQNKQVFLPPSLFEEKSGSCQSVKHRVTELELQHLLGNISPTRKNVLDRKDLSLNLPGQNDKVICDNNDQHSFRHLSVPGPGEEFAMSQTKPTPQVRQAVLVKKEIWDPGDKESPTSLCQVQSENIATQTSRDIPWSCSSRGTMNESINIAETNKEDSPVYISELKLPDVDDTVVPGKTIQTASSGCLRNLTTKRKDGDPFSAQLDRVFEREERKQQRCSSQVPVYVVEVPSEVVRECPSRQNSWSSCDSAVVLGQEPPSRQNSWGSADTRLTLPSRNSSWSSYDMRLPMQYVTERGEKDINLVSSSFSHDCDDVPWYPGTVKRTKQKLEEGSCAVKRVCSDEHQQTSVDTSLCSGRENVNMKLHGPRPYHNRVPDRFNCSQSIFPSSFPENTSEYLGNMSAIPTHYASTPTLSSYNEKLGISTDQTKITTSQPNITILDCKVRTKPKKESAISKEDLNRQICTLASDSSAAESTSSLSNVICSEASLKCLKHSPSQSDLSSTYRSSDQSASPCIVNAIPSLVKKQSRLSEIPREIHKKDKLPEYTTSKAKEPVITSKSSDIRSQNTGSGIVKSLKKEFEAKSISKCEKLPTGEPCAEFPHDLRARLDSVKVHSLPSSPEGSYNCPEDLSVKMLVDRYEESGNSKRPESSVFDNRTRFVSESEVVSSHHPRKSSLDTQISKNSSLFVNNLKNEKEGRKYPATAGLVVANVCKAANKKQQQGKTHPLSRLTFGKSRHNNPVYNTM